MQLSIVIPIFNTNKTLIERCLSSILKDKEFIKNNVEVVIVDDGSSNKETINFLKKYKNRNVSIIFSQKNSGSAVARDIGMKNAKGDFIIFVDSDDYLKDGYISKIINTINSNHDLYLFSINKILRWSTPFIIVKKKWIINSNINYFNEISDIKNYGEDTFFMIRCLTAATEFEIIEFDNYEELYFYDESASFNSKNIEENFQYIYWTKQIIDAIITTNKLLSKQNKKLIYRSIFPWMKFIIFRNKQKEILSQLNDLELSFYKKNKIPKFYYGIFSKTFFKKSFFCILRYMHIIKDK